VWNRGALRAILRIVLPRSPAVVLVALLGVAAVASTGCAERARNACREVEPQDVAAWTSYTTAARAYAPATRGAVEPTDAGAARFDELKTTLRAMSVLSGGGLADQKTVDGLAAATRAMNALETAGRKEATMADSSAGLAEKALAAARGHDATAAHTAALAAAAPAPALLEARMTTLRAANGWAKAIQAIPFPGVPPVQAEGTDLANPLHASLPDDAELATARASSEARWAKCQSVAPQ
jgi:hypothetical protein